VRRARHRPPPEALSIRGRCRGSAAGWALCALNAASSWSPEKSSPTPQCIFIYTATRVRGGSAVLSQFANSKRVAKTRLGKHQLPLESPRPGQLPARRVALTPLSFAPAKKGLERLPYHRCVLAQGAVRYRCTVLVHRLCPDTLSAVPERTTVAAVVLPILHATRPERQNVQACSQYCFATVSFYPNWQPTGVICK
jgi:hypothetical protein